MHKFILKATAGLEMLTVNNYIRSGQFLTVNVRASVNNYIRSGHSLTVNV
jgi:hypothetical protein